MEIQEGLKKAAVEAAKAKDQTRLDTVRMAVSAIHYREIEKRGKLSEEEVKGVLAGLCKQRREAIDLYQKGNRQDLAAKEKRELEILESFLPPQLTRDQVLVKAREVLQATGVQGPEELGKVMKILMKDLAGQADGALVSSVVKELLTK